MRSIINREASAHTSGRARGEAAYHRASTTAAEEDITLSALLSTFWRGLWLFLLVFVLFTLSAVLFLKIKSPVYTATMIVAPAEYDLGAAGRLVNALEQYTRFATLAQVPARFAHPPSAFEEYLESFGSQRVARQIAAQGNVLQHLFPNEWDIEAQNWRAPPGVMATSRSAVMRFYGYPPWVPPGPERLSDFLRAKIVIGPVRGSDIYAVRFRDRDPGFAVRFLELLHRTADETMKEEVALRTNQQIDSIQLELASAEDPSRRAALESLLTEQYRVQAHLTSGVPFAARLVREPAAGTTPTSMNPLLAIGLASCVGAILGVFVVFLRAALTRSAPVD